ncbi:MAG: alpha/beta hydrolase [Bacteroidetes bacterium]|nr:alpha/beta hydrolase [Bacteroidota bacterium]
MNKPNISLSLIILSLGILLSLSSCQKTSSFTLSETVYVRHQGADMPAYIHGNSEDKVFIIVLHGAGSFGLAFRDGAFTSELEKRYAVVYWDQRGQSMAQGHYSKPEDVVELMAEDVMALVAVLKHKYGEDIKLFLMGHSWGGALGTTVLVKDNQQFNFEGWIAIDAAHDFPFGGRARRSLYLETADEQIAAGNLVDEWQAFKDEIIPLDSTSEEDYPILLQKAFVAMDLLLDADVVNHSGSSEKVRRGILENNPITWQVSALLNSPVQEAIERDYSLSDQLGNITIPTLLLWGKYDFSVPPVLGYDALGRLGSADKKLVIFNRSIHHPMDTEPEKFGQEVIEFVERNR